jgi:thiosulfate dehydrogenase
VKVVRDQLQLDTASKTKFVTPRFSNMLDKTNSGQLVYGMRLMSETGILLPEHVGNSLNCSSCHTNAGTVANASPYIGVAAQFPAYAPRAGKIIDLEDRINGCFKRSMNGKGLAKDSTEMKAMIAYMNWVKGPYKKGDQIPGRGIGKIDKTLVPNVDNGIVVYQAQCAVCHGNNGEGVKKADGRYAFPMVWGDESFNLGAGMARTYTAAAFIKQNMPMGHNTKFPLGQGGSLTDQEAVDVAEYFSHMGRPDFTDKNKDWPNGEKPKDARY